MKLGITKVSFGSLWAGSAAVLCAVMMPPALPQFAAMAQANGDQKCSPEGYVLEFRKYSLEAITGWKNTYARCDPRNNRNSDDDDRPLRRASRDDDNENSGRSTGGQPEDGDEKCGPDGYIMKYDWNEYLQKGTWRSSARRCVR